MQRSYPDSGCAVNPPKLPITVGNLERILGAARSMPETLQGIPADRWWPALILAILDTGAYAPELLRLKPDAYDRDQGTLVVAGTRHALHAHTANALEGLRRYEREFLFPWPKDGGNGAKNFFMLYHDYRQILHKAGLPAAQKKPLLRLRRMAQEAPEVLDCIDPYRPFFAVPGKPTQHRQGRRKPHKRKRPSYPTDAVYVIENDSPDTLKRYFHEVYQPLKLVNCSPKTLETYRGTIKKFSEFLACDATLHHLNDDDLEAFSAFVAQSRSPSTVNKLKTHLCAIWRHAWKKRRVDEMPRDVEKLKVDKTLPDAWSQEEMARLLEAASQIQCQSRGMPGRLWWPALILTIYDTGLRVGAVVQLRSQDLDLGTGLLRVWAKTQKQRADQIFRLHDDTVAALRAIGPERRELIFNVPNWVAFKNTAYAQFNRILKAADLHGDGNDKFHKIRRTSATFLADASGIEEAKKHLGHASLSTTMRYLDFTKIRHQVYAADVMQRPEWEPPQERTPEKISDRLQSLTPEEQAKLLMLCDMLADSTNNPS